MEECSICLENMVINIAILDCIHKYHIKCIKSWIHYKNDRQNKCPICNQGTRIMCILSKIDNLHIDNHKFLKKKIMDENNYKELSEVEESEFGEEFGELSEKKKCCCYCCIL